MLLRSRAVRNLIVRSLHMRWELFKNPGQLIENTVQTNEFSVIKVQFQIIVFAVAFSFPSPDYSPHGWILSVLYQRSRTSKSKTLKNGGAPVSGPMT